MSTQQTCYTIGQLAEITSSKIIGDPNYPIYGIDNLECATGNDASFLANALYLKALKKSKAGVVFIDEPLPDTSTNQLVHPHPSKAFQQIIDLFHNSKLTLSAYVGIHPTAVIHPSVKLGDNVTIGPNTTIDHDTIILDNTHIYGNVYIGPNVKIGHSCIIYSQVTINGNCDVGNFVILQPSAVIGSCGFGYTTNSKGHHIKLNHIGKVVLEDHVEIGASTCIDRARFKETRVKSGAKIDNLVQIAHGVQVGENCIIISQAGIAGSTSLGKYNVIAGQVGVVGHLQLGDHITIAARGAVTKNLKHPGRYGGAPAIPEEKFYRQQMHFRKLDIYVSKIKELEAKLESLEKKLNSL